MYDSSKQGVYDYVSTEYVLAGVKSRLRLKDTTSDDMYLLDIINRGIKRLRNLGTMVPAQADIPIEDFKAPLPAGFVRFTKNFPIRLFDPGDINSDAVTFTTTQSTIETTMFDIPTVTQSWGGATANYNIPVFLNSPFLSGLGDLAINGLDIADPLITVNIANGYMYFSTNCTFTYVKISYLSSAVDEDGYLMIPAIAEEAITEFALYQYKIDNKYPPIEWNEHKMNWVKGKAHVKAVLNMPDSDQYQYINRKINSIL